MPATTDSKVDVYYNKYNATHLLLNKQNQQLDDLGKCFLELSRLKFEIAKDKIQLDRDLTELEILLPQLTEKETAQLYRLQLLDLYGKTPRPV